METEQPIIYLDNAATTFPKPEVVYQAMDSFYRNYGGNAGRGSNPLARRAASLVNETRERLKVWLNAPDVVFQPSATAALNTIILGAHLRAGDVVYVTPFEHNSVLRPLEHLRRTVGIEVRVLPHDRQTFECKLDEVKALFRVEPPAMLCVTQVSNVFGSISPVDNLTTLAKRTVPNVVTVIDGAQAAGLKTLDMSKVDALVFSGHKSLYGPYGVAGIALGTKWRPEPLLYGGTGTQSESLEMPNEGSSRYEAGSHNISAIAGLHAALSWMEEKGRDHINITTDDLTVYLRMQLSKLQYIQLYTPQHHTGIISFTINGISPQSVEAALGAQNIAVRAGLHCAPWAHEWAATITRLGTVRVSLGYFSTQNNVESLLNALAKLG